MNKKYVVLLLLIIIAGLSYGQENRGAVDIGERKTIASKVLQEGRAFQIYLPASYFYSEKGSYPVIYVMDGDYNFHYETGLIELLSTISERIPEVIVVGISDNGSEKYRNNCKPTNATEKSGNATNFMAFIETELKPYINQNYRTSEYDILIGHSLGGLFVTNYLIENQQAFDTYIAIEPALWWNDYEIVQRADSVFQNQKKLESTYFLSLGNMKGMGVRPFVGVLDTYFPDQHNWTFSHYENENHNSVGLVTIKNALEVLFRDWEMTREKFQGFEDARQLLSHFVDLNKKFKSSFTLPKGLIGNVVYFYRDNEAELNTLEEGIKKDFPSSVDEFYVQKALVFFERNELEKAKNIYESTIKSKPGSFQSYDGLSKVYYAQGKYVEAEKMSEHALEIAREMNARQWLLNELESNREKIKRTKHTTVDNTR